MSEYQRFWIVTLGFGAFCGFFAIALIEVLDVQSHLLAFVMGGGFTLGGVIVAGRAQL